MPKSIIGKFWSIIDSGLITIAVNEIRINNEERFLVMAKASHLDGLSLSSHFLAQEHM